MGTASYPRVVIGQGTFVEEGFALRGKLYFWLCKICHKISIEGISPVFSFLMIFIVSTPLLSSAAVSGLGSGW